MILDYSQFITEEGTKGIVNFVSADRNASVGTILYVHFVEEKLKM